MLNSVGFSRRGRARVLQMPFLYFLIASDFYKQYFKEKCIFFGCCLARGGVALYCNLFSSLYLNFLHLVE